MPTPEFPRTLPTIEQRIDADYLTARFDAARARLADRLPSGPGLEQQVRPLPSQQLRDLVRHASLIVQDADLTATPLEQLEHQRLQRLAAARLAVTELASRQHAALRRLETDPPAYLTTAIGRPTLLLRRDDQAALGSWRDLALRVESYRLQYDVTDPARTLGPRPTGLAQRADRSRIATDIAWSPFGSIPDRQDLGWLNVIDQPDRDPAGALAMLAQATRRHASLLGDAGAALEARPSTVLRRRLEEAIGLLRQRPPDTSPGNGGSGPGTPSTSSPWPKATSPRGSSAAASCRRCSSSPPTRLRF